VTDELGIGMLAEEALQVRKTFFERYGNVKLTVAETEYVEDVGRVPFGIKAEERLTE